MPAISLDLTGKWHFKEYPLAARRMRDLDSGQWLPTTVPSSVFNGLINAGRITQAEFDTFPERFAWVSEKPWVYKKTFDAPHELLDCDRIDLLFEGLDTITSIWLNGKLIGKTDNMFVPFRFDVKAFLKPEKNSLLVKFDSPVQYAKKLMNRYTSFGESDFRNPWRVYIRKAQYQFGWDFCPALPGCGIWRPVRIEGIKKAVIKDINIRTIDCNRNFADLHVALTLDTITTQDLLCRLILSGDDRIIEHNLTFRPGENLHSRIIRIEKPILWFPTGYGKPHLYKMRAQLTSGDEILDEKEKRFGLRIIRLNRLSEDHKEQFRFEINDQPIFIRGANWMPPSMFPGSVTNEDYEKLLNAAAQANVNMLRVWGGGYYESDRFYDICDRLGILIWQDFMFAGAYYPDCDWFTEQVEKEALATIKRLRTHPCLALWCGNTDIDSMHAAGKLGKSKKFYGRAIYHKLLPRIVTELDPGAEYIPTTPLKKRAKSKANPMLTVHEFGVWSGHQPVHNYLCHPRNIPPFVAEFGIQSLPDIEALRTFCPPERLRIASDVLEKHNYQLDGNSRLYRYIGDLFGSAADLDQFAYLSQITQARAAKTLVEYLRAHKTINSGVLFRQFNDCCPAISFSAIDQNKTPKALYYYAKRFFANILVTVVPKLEKLRVDSPPQVKSLSVIAINDTDRPITATLNCRLIDLFGRIIDQLAFPIAIGPFAGSPTFKLPPAMVAPEEPQESCLHLLVEKDNRKIAENLFFYSPDKHIHWPDTEMKSDLRQISRDHWTLKLTSKALAKDVQIKTSIPARLSDNFLDLLPRQQREINILPMQQPSPLPPHIDLRSAESVFNFHTPD